MNIYLASENRLQGVALVEDQFIGKIVTALTVADRQDESIYDKNRSYCHFVPIDFRDEAQNDERYYK